MNGRCLSGFRTWHGLLFSTDLLPAARGSTLGTLCPISLNRDGPATATPLPHPCTVEAGKPARPPIGGLSLRHLDAPACYEQRVSSALEDPAPAFLGDLGAEALVLPGATPAMELDALFRADRALRAVVIETAGVYALLTRAQLEFHLTGRLGYGRELSARAVATELLPDTAPIMSAGLGLSGAAQAVLERPEEYRYQDLLVLGSGGPRIVPVSEVFESLSAVFRHGPCTTP